MSPSLRFAVIDIDTPYTTEERQATLKKILCPVVGQRVEVRFSCMQADRLSRVGWLT